MNPLIEIRKRALSIETVYHEGGPVAEVPLKMAAAMAVVRNPYAGRYEEDLMPFMAELRSLGRELAEELVDALGGTDRVEVYSKAAIVGINGELEHGAVWHEAGGCAIHAAYVRSHFNSMDVGLQDAPRPNEILFALVMGSGGRVHSRLGGLLKEAVQGNDGLR